MAELVWRLTDDGALACGEVRLQPRKPEETIVRSPAALGDNRFVLWEWTAYKLKGQGVREVWLGDVPVEPIEDGL